MSAEDEAKSTTSPSSKITGLDVLKNIGGGLAIAFLVYWLPVLTDQFFSPTEIRYRQVTLGDHSGYLFSIQNYSRHAIEEVTFFIDTLGIGPIFQDGAISIESNVSSHPGMIKLKTLAPSSETTLFVSLNGRLEKNQIHVSSSSAVTAFEDAKVVERQLWSSSAFFSSAFSALLYIVFGLYLSAHQKTTQVKLQDIRADMERLQDQGVKIKDNAEKQIKEIEARLTRARVHLVRRVIRLDEEVEVWRRFFRHVYTSAFGAKSESERAIECILKICGVSLVRRLRDYSETEFLDVLEASEPHRTINSPSSKTDH